MSNFVNNLKKGHNLSFEDSKILFKELMEGKYTVEVSSKKISHMKNESSPIEYWIALEPESNYSV